MSATVDSRAYLEISVNDRGEYIASRRGKELVSKFRQKPPDIDNLEKVLTIEIYREKARPQGVTTTVTSVSDKYGTAGSASPTEPLPPTEPAPETETKPPCWEFVFPPGRWICGCDDCPSE
jgi:hypothetical protein